MNFFSVCNFGEFPASLAGSTCHLETDILSRSDCHQEQALCHHNPAPHPGPGREAAPTPLLPVTVSIRWQGLSGFTLEMVVFYLSSCPVAAKLDSKREERRSPCLPRPRVLAELGLAGASPSLRPAVLQKSPVLCGAPPARPHPRPHGSQQVSKVQPRRGQHGLRSAAAVLLGVGGGAGALCPVRGREPCRRGQHPGRGAVGGCAARPGTVTWRTAQRPRTGRRALKP